MDRLKRKELKSDEFASTVGHTVEYVTEHRTQFIRWGIIGGIVLVLVLGGLSWRNYRRGQREQALNAALEIQNAPVGQVQNEYVRSFPTEQARMTAATKAFQDIVNQYGGSDEGIIAEYYLGALAADQGRMIEAQKYFESVSNSGKKDYASLAALSLAEIYKSEGKTAQAENLLRPLVDKPTEFVSKEQATIALAGVISKTKPDEARKMLEPLRTSTRRAVSTNAITAIGDIAQGR